MKKIFLLFILSSTFTYSQLSLGGDCSEVLTNQININQRKKFEHVEGKLVEAKSNSKQDVYVLGDGQNAFVYRVIPHSVLKKPYIVKKYYTGYMSSAMDAFAMNKLRQFTKEINMHGVKVAERAKWFKFEGTSRYYKDVEGQTFSDVIKNDLLPPDKILILEKRFEQFNLALQELLENKYKNSGRLYEFYNEMGYGIDFWVVNPVWKSLEMGWAFSLKHRNIIVDHKTLDLIIIDSD